ncbi:class I SAM-dependent methyltransferase [Streptomyces sp. NBC_01456]|uniref:class I SAM-dependent DNA methyltransferase n=1 Tax=Streptomyces sp. NBC_01456 TaxID=2975868 RepID=UPI002E304669|nr:class I SAM-dependent methyltransferase [Streptomyces sp. NBC_01456]
MNNFESQGARWDTWAPFYDEDTKNQDASKCVSALAGIAGDGPALELGVGTGRIALPLGRNGTEVVGIDASHAMLKQLHERTGDLPVSGRRADMAEFDLGQRFPLVYIVASSFFLLPTQELQMACFASAARHLADGGRFAVEAAMPQSSGLAGPRDQMIVREISEDHLKFSAFLHDPVTQTVRAQEVRFGGPPEEWRLLPNVMRYAYPAELDLMARLAGLELVSRTADWSGNPLKAASTHHVSVYTPQAPATVTPGAPA